MWYPIRRIVSCIRSSRTFSSRSHDIEFSRTIPDPRPQSVFKPVDTTGSGRRGLGMRKEERDMGSGGRRRRKETKTSTQKEAQTSRDEVK